MNIQKTVEEIQKDIRNLKLKAFEPEKEEAKAVLDYLSWEEGEPKENFEKAFAKDLVLINEWFEIYCEEHDCTKENALERVID